jgi:hypothetical protein
VRSYRIGRKSDNDIVIQNPTVSRHHAELREAHAGSYELRDLGSSQGTHVHNGKGWDKIKRRDIDAKTPIRFGDYKTTVAELLDLDSGVPRESYRRAAGGRGALPAWALPAAIGGLVLVVGIVVAVLLLTDNKPSREEWVAACMSTGQVPRERCLCVWDLFEPTLTAKDWREMIEHFRNNRTPDAMSPGLRAKWDALFPQVQSRCVGVTPRR